MPVRDGLIAEYLFSGDARDTSGSGCHGTVNGPTLTVDRFGKSNTAYAFDGIDDEIILSPPPPIGATFAVSVWARFDNRDLRSWTSCIIAQDNGNDDDQSRRVFQLSVFNQHVVWHRMVCARDPICRHRVRFGEWYHFTATYDGTTHRLYVDGELCDSVTHSFWTHTEEPLRIGRKGTSESFFYFRGSIDDVRIYNRALDANEVTALFTEGGFIKPHKISANGDPLSGRWGQRGVMFLDLQLDSGSRITGRVMHGRPGVYVPIGEGNFDRESGAFALSGQAPHHKSGEMIPYRIDGVVDDGEATVTAAFGSYNDNLFFTRGGARWPWRHTLARSLMHAINRILGTR